jgi:hypothetical protein
MMEAPELVLPRSFLGGEKTRYQDRSRPAEASHALLRCFWQKALERGILARIPLVPGSKICHVSIRTALLSHSKRGRYRGGR